MEVCSTNDICAVRWVDNKIVTLASNNLTQESLQNCSLYCRQKKRKVTNPQPFLIRRCNEHMGGVDQLDSYLNNLHHYIGGKKWYWMQLINFFRVMQVAAIQLYSMIHPDEKISQLVFIRGLVREYIQNKRSTELILLDIRRLVPPSANNHFLVSFTLRA